MHALNEQQRQSFEQHAHVLAVLQEQGRQLHGLLIAREKSDNNKKGKGSMMDIYFDLTSPLTHQSLSVSASCNQVM
jgi:hypothetical protein